MIRTSAARPTGTVSFLFTDIEGSTALWGDDRPAMSAAQAAHDEILRRRFQAWGGYVFSIAGDGYGVAFPTGAAAVGAALAIQRDLAAEPWPASAVVRVRMGIHTGEAEERAGNYFGPPVNQAARLMGAANGGQIVVSALTASLLLPNAGPMAAIELVDLGQVALKGIVEAVRLFGVATPEHPWLDRPLATTQRSAGNLPRLLTSFIGGHARLHELGRRLRPGGLLSLVGPGGVGKSRLAVEMAWLTVDEFPDGAWLTELASVSPDDDPVDALASTLSIQPRAGMGTVAAVVDWCVGRRMLLLLDNCEHVRRPMAELAAAILAQCPTVALLSTSQVALGVPGEEVEHLTGLSEPEASELFRDRSARPIGDEQPAVELICRHLDGVPLAIELAAARVGTLSPTELLGRLDRRLRLLRSGATVGASRHQTLRAAVDWSYGLLDDDQRWCFDQLSIFAGSFDLEAATAILVDDEGRSLDEYEVIDRLGDLVDTSMVVSSPVAGATRYRLLETLRQYGAERLAERDGVEEARNRHLAHYRARVERLHADWFSPEQARADRGFEMEWDNLRVALHWAVATRRKAASQALVLASAWHALERIRYEHRSWTAEALDLAVAEDATHPATFAVLAAWAYFAAELPEAVLLAQQGVQRHADHPEVAGCLAWMLYGLMGADRVDEATGVRPALAAELDRPLRLDVEFMARMALIDTDPVGASTADQQAFAALCDRLGSPMARARAAQLRANRLLAVDPPDLEGALAAYRLSIEIGGDDAPSETLWSLGGVAGCLDALGDPQAPAAIVEALKRSYDSRLWFELDLVLGIAATHLLHRQPRAAALILGHLATRPASAIGPITAGRRAAADEVMIWPDGTSWMEEGAAMDRHRIVAYALGALAADSVGSA